MSAYYRRLTSSETKQQLEAALAWTEWEMSTNRLLISEASIKKAEDPKFALAFARIECHYFVNGGFLTRDDQLIQEATILKDIPTIIVQGRYDMVCPAKTAWDLFKVMPHAEFHMVPDAGHSMTEPGIFQKLLQAANKFRDL